MNNEISPETLLISLELSCVSHLHEGFDIEEFSEQEEKRLVVSLSIK